MKIKQLKQSIAALTVISSGAAFGFAFENFDHTSIPDTTINSINWINTICGAGCLATGGEFSKSSAALRVDLTAGTDNLDGTISVSGVGVPAGGTDAGVGWDINITHLEALGGTVIDLTVIATELDMYTWDMVFDYNGNMLSWALKSVTVVSGSDFITCHYSADYAAPSAAAASPTAAGISYAFSGDPALVVCSDNDPAFSGTLIDPTAPPAGITLDSTNTDYHATCDIKGECGQLSKSVPVPAFAAATLGLGLVGITYLTGRRKKIV